MSTAPGDDEDEFPTIDDLIEAQQLEKTGRPVRSVSSFSAIAFGCLCEAVPRADLRSASKSRSIVLIQVPSPDWIADMVTAVRRIWTNSKVSTFETNAKPRTWDTDGHLRQHVGGKGLVVVSNDIENAVPASLRTTAAKLYTIKPPSAVALRAAAGEIVTGDVRKAFKALDFRGLGFVELGLCLVVGDTALQAATKIRHAVCKQANSEDKSHLPTLSETHGYGEARQWASDLVADIADFKAGRLGWDEVDHGAILYGPPGTGKSLFVRIIAKEAEVPVVQTSIGGYFANGSGHLDGVIRQQREAFARAAAMAPAILCLEELDALPSRNSDGRNQDFWKPVLTDLLLLLDSAMADRAGVVVIGLTNRVQDLDDALIRPGRMDRLLFVPPPGPEELAGILRHYLKDDLQHEALRPLALTQPGATGADAVLWVKSARRRARAERRKMVLEDLSSQMMAGKDRSPAARRRIAVHEIGHVIAALVAGIPVASVTIAQTSRGSGLTALDFNRDRILTKPEMEAYVVVLLAGRAAEAVMLGSDPSTGSGGSPDSDLGKATQVVRSMYADHGMGDQLIYRDGKPDPSQIDAINADLKRLYSLAVGIVTTHSIVAWAMVQKLLVSTALDGPELDAMFKASLEAGSTILPEVR